MTLRAASSPNAARLIAASAVAVSHTGNTNETTLATITIPAGLLGTNGGIEVRTLWAMTNNANTKLLRVRYSGAAGTAYLSQNFGGTAGAAGQTRWRNRNSTSSQIGTSQLFPNSNTILTNVPVISAVDTSAETSIILSGQLSVGTDSVTLDSYEVWFLPAS